MYKYSATTGSFYPVYFLADYKNLPTDLIDADEPTFQACTNRPQGSTLAIVAGVVTVIPAPTPTAAQQLATAQDVQDAIIDAGYAAAIYADISFTTAAGVTQTFQADAISQSVLETTSVGYTRRNAVPAGFFWKAKDNTRVPFTLADLNGLYDAMLDRGDIAFVHRTNQKDAIAAATTVSAVQAIVW